MKRIYFLLGITVIMQIVACQEENDILIPDPVSDVVITPGHGEVILSWSNPSSNDFYYVDIQYIDSKGLTRSEKVSRYVSADTIIGFADTNTYEFALTANNQAGGASEPVSISIAPLEPAFLSVLNTIEMVPDFGGAIVEWENETGKKVTVNVSYKDREGKKTSALFTSFESGVGYISDLESKDHTFEVYVSDDSDNRSETQPFTLTPLAEDIVDKSLWSVVDFSSEEPAEGGNPNGLVIAAFDDELSTFWHTQWSGGSPGYPHHFVIDMEQEVTISRFECIRRQGDSRGQTECQFLVSIDGDNWEDLGLFAFDSSTDDPQSYRLTSNPKARYFKYVATQGPEFFAFLSEITIYGSID